jgi:hypothetical protein
MMYVWRRHLQPRSHWNPGSTAWRATSEPSHRKVIKSSHDDYRLWRANLAWL